MVEDFPSQNFDREPSDKREECDNLLEQAECEPDNLSAQQRQRLDELGYDLLAEGNAYSAVEAFRTVHDFEGLREVADKLLESHPKSYDPIRSLELLEDFETIRNLLNRKDIDSESIYDQAFWYFREDLWSQVERFLQEKGLETATGIINERKDLLAIHELADQYDIAVPIARGGLPQGAIADLWGLPTKVIDIDAHDKETPESRWVDAVGSEDFEGKRILLFDKDAISGSTLKRAIGELSEFDPSKIGVYFAHDSITPEEENGMGTIEENVPNSLDAHYPESAPKEQVGDIYLEAHEAVGTLYGQRRKAERNYMSEVEKMEEQFPELAMNIENFVSEQLEAFDSLNPLLDGVADVRKHILSRLDDIFKQHEQYKEFGMYDPSYGTPAEETINRFISMLENTPLMPQYFEKDLIKARYKNQAKDAAKKRGIENQHVPAHPVSAFNTAQEVVEAGFESILIVGPEGFAYEPYFRDLGISNILAVNIPESGIEEKRTITAFDNLTQLQNKKVAVVEDDVRTGATLRKVIENIDTNEINRLGLYLGQPESFQRKSNVPEEFDDIFLSEVSEVKREGKFKEHLNSKGIRVFKSDEL